MHKIKQMWCKCKTDQNGLHNQLCPIPLPPAIRLEFIISFFGGSFLELFCEAVLLLMCGGTPIVLQYVYFCMRSHSQMQLQTYINVYMYLNLDTNAGKKKHSPCQFGCNFHSRQTRIYSRCLTKMCCLQLWSL